MPSNFYQATVDEQAQFSWDSSLFVSDLYHGFKKKQKYGRKVPRLQTTIKSH